MSKEKSIAFEQVKGAMSLRTPQLEALEKFHQTIDKAELPLKEMTAEDIVTLFKNDNPNWDFEHDATEFTIHMATGVGKTRLIGALIAYLYLSKESYNFMIISSRTEIIRKFITVCTGQKDYLFVDQSLVDYPTVFNSESSVRDYTQSGMFDSGPRIWVISPQSLTANNARMKFKGQFDKCSPVEYIQGLDDLVIFFDESHHLGLDVHDIALKDRLFEKGNCLAVEPGVYIPEWETGFRIEDDVLVTDDFSGNGTNKFVKINEIPDGFEGVDAGEESRKAFADVLKSSKTILMNGPVGAFENPKFAEGTKAVLSAVVEATKNGAISVIGGGDSVSAAKKFCNAEDFTHVSTGGGASLEFIEGKILPGVAALDNK